MFLFESKQEKAIREDVEKNMEICISNPKKYNEAKEVLLARLKGSDQKVIEMIVDNVKATIKNEDYPPIRKSQAILLLKDLMQTHNKALGKYVVKKLLKRLKILAQYKSNVKDQNEDERGKDIFGQVKKDQEQYAIKFFNILLNAFQEWGKNWPKAPDGPHKEFQRDYNELLMEGVQFPKKYLKVVQPVIDVPKPIPKPKPRQQIISRKAKETQQNQTLKALRTNLDKFYQDIKQPLQLLASILPGCDVQSLPIVRDIASQIEKDLQAGLQFQALIEDKPNYKMDDLKLRKFVDFVEKMQKDLRILNKKPEQVETFKSKYTKLCKQLQEALKKKQNSQLSPSKIQKTSNSIDNSKLPSQKQRPTSPQIKAEEPKIKNQNRYTSVQGNQVLQHFSKNAEFQSNGGQSAHSDRFGSFGGATQRHRASIPQSSSPQFDKNKQKPNSDRKQQKEQKHKEIIAIAEQKTIQLSKYVFNQNQNKSSQIKPKIQSQKLFQGSEAMQKRQSQKGSTKNHQQPGEEQDFFAKVQHHNDQNRQINYNPRRKKPQPKQDNEDFFNAKIPSRIDSSKLSGFNFSQIGIESKKDKINEPNNFEKEVATKQLRELGQNPFGLDTSHHSQNQKQLQPSNYFERYDPNKSNSVDFFEKSVVRYAKQMELKAPIQNPFATGNFGNMPDIQTPNPFDKQSMRSKHSSPKDNPFGNQSFEKISYKSRQAIDSKKNIQNLNSIAKIIQNPFNSNVYQGKDPFNDSGLNLSISVANPFQTSTHKSNKSKNPFEQVQEFFKPPTKPNIDGLSQRNSFKNIDTERKDNNFERNLGFSNIGQPIRDSLVLSARVGNDYQQNGLNFSQFQDIGQPKQEDNVRAPNPFNLSGQKKENHQFSGFSLSNFPGIGQQQSNSNQQTNQLNLSAANFFANYQKQSVNSRKSKNIEQPKVDFFASEMTKKQKGSKEIFQDFNLSKSDSNISKNNNKETKSFHYEIQKQKTVVSAEQNFFDLAHFDKVSAIHEKPKTQQDFGWGKTQNRSNKSIKQRQQADNKSLSWGDFDKVPSQKGNDREQYKQPNQDRSLLVESKLKRPNQMINPNEPNAKINIKQSQQNSLSLNLEDFAPLSKKGIEWNPLAKIVSLKQQTCTYNVDDKKIQLKKLDLLQKQKEYHQKLQKFRLQRSEHQKIRNVYIQKMKTIQQIIKQKSEYEHILLKLKQTNSEKQDKIEQIHQKIKKARQVKQKLLQKQKQLYDVTKNQIYSQQKSIITQRNMSSKWQMFNKNLQHNRNSMYTLQSHYTNGY